LAVQDEYGRLTAYGNQLVETHIRLRDALDDLRDGVPPGRDPATHCLAFCEAVTAHHTGEDAEMFPLLAARHPELRELLDGLKRDHVMIAQLLGNLAAVAADRDRTALEVEGLSAILGSHFAWQEKRLVAILNEVRPGDMAPQW
jgi:hypothetical protein